MGHKPGLIHPYPNDNEVVTEKGSEGVADDKNGKKMKTKRKKQSEGDLLDHTIIVIHCDTFTIVITLVDLIITYHICCRWINKRR